MCKVHVQLFYGKDAERYRVRYLQGLENDETPYGFHLAEDEGFKVSFSRDGRRTLLTRAVKKLVDFDLFHAWHNRRAMAEADVIWTMTEGEAFGAALLMRLGVIPRKPIVSNTVWLLNRWPALTWPRRKIYQSLTREITVMTVHSDASLPIARRAFPTLRTERMFFGINTDYYPITPPETREGPIIHIVAAGNDRTRDWETLLQAFGADDRFRLTLACGWLRRESLNGRPRAKLISNVAAEGLRALYQSADVIAVAMEPNVFSGITVALEAAALGKPILSTRTGGVPTYFDDSEVIFAPPTDPVALRDAVLATTAEARRALAERAQKRFMALDYSTRGLVARYSHITREILGTDRQHDAPGPAE